MKIDNKNIKLGTTPEGNHCLLIEKVTKGNAGEYELVAKNDIGDNSSKACLTVSCKFWNIAQFPGTAGDPKDRGTEN